jgi:hypothetical protein
MEAAQIALLLVEIILPRNVIDLTMIIPYFGQAKIQCLSGFGLLSLLFLYYFFYGGLINAVDPWLK